MSMSPASIPENTREALSLLCRTYPAGVTFTSSLSKEDQAVTNMIAEWEHPVKIVTLDTGRHFPEYYDLLDRTERKYKIRIETFSPESKAIEAWVSENGINGFYDSIEQRKACCFIRKVAPLKRALSDSKIWITGLRSAQSEGRGTLERFSFDEMTGCHKFNPILDWSDKELDDYIAEHSIPINPLHNNGYESIGCAPCTRPIEPGEHPRNGRWWWESSKKECGLHQ